MAANSKFVKSRSGFAHKLEIGFVILTSEVDCSQNWSYNNSNAYVYVESGGYKSLALAYEHRSVAGTRVADVAAQEGPRVGGGDCPLLAARLGHSHRGQERVPRHAGIQRQVPTGPAAYKVAQEGTNLHRGAQERKWWVNTFRGAVSLMIRLECTGLTNRTSCIKPSTCLCVYYLIHD